jgi:hypothetical protein
MLNTLSNHGYLPRSGRGITRSQLTTALRTHISISSTLAKFLVDPPFRLHTEPSGCREPEDVNEDGEEVLHFERLCRAGAIEHPVSLCRHDRGRGDFVNADPALVDQLVECGTGEDGALNASAFGRLRTKRYNQCARNGLEYGEFNKKQHELALGECALVLGVFGKGWRWEVPKDWLRVLFAEERLPVNEGWVKRAAWKELGLVETAVLRTAVEWFTKWGNDALTAKSP